MNVSHTQTSSEHPQCNAQVEVLNKTVKKFLQSFVNDTMLNWESFLPALVLSYNASYHSTISTTPFELLFRIFEDIQKINYWETLAAERFNLLQKLKNVPMNLLLRTVLKQKYTLTDIKAIIRLK
jgi:hypothetical protein